MDRPTGSASNRFCPDHVLGFGHSWSRGATLVIWRRRAWPGQPDDTLIENYERRKNICL